jgi:hypothetical protein
MAFERVYTVLDYYDGPRSGIAAVAGKPHYYHCEWNDSKDDYGETFVLTPIDQETFALAMEQWSIWREWEEAFHRGDALQSTHPGIPGSHARYAELETILKARISALSCLHRRARADFRVDTAPGQRGELEVEWTYLGS